jgi:hypothetical protein
MGEFKSNLRECLISSQQVIFILGNTGTPEHRNTGTGNGEHTKNNKIQSPPLTRGRLGWGQAIVVDTLIMT